MSIANQSVAKQLEQKDANQSNIYRSKYSFKIFTKGDSWPFHEKLQLFESRQLKTSQHFYFTTATITKTHTIKRLL